MRNKFNRTVIVDGPKGFKDYAQTLSTKKNSQDISSATDMEQLIQVKIFKWFEDQYLSNKSDDEPQETPPEFASQQIQCEILSPPISKKIKNTQTGGPILVSRSTQFSPAKKSVHFDNDRDIKKLKEKLRIQLYKVTSLIQSIEKQPKEDNSYKYEKNLKSIQRQNQEEQEQMNAQVQQLQTKIFVLENKQSQIIKLNQQEMEIKQKELKIAVDKKHQKQIEILKQSNQQKLQENQAIISKQNEKIDSQKNQMIQIVQKFMNELKKQQKDFEQNLSKIKFNHEIEKQNLRDQIRESDKISIKDLSEIFPENDYELQINSLTLRNQDLKNQMAKMAERYQKMMLQLGTESGITLIEQAEKEIQKSQALQNEKNQLEDQIKKFNEQIQNAWSQKAEAVEKIKKLRLKIENLEQELQVYTSLQINQDMGDCGNQMLSELKQKLLLQVQDQISLQKTIKEQQKSLIKKQETMSSVEKWVQKDAELILKMQQNINELNLEIKKQKEEIKGLEEQNEDLNEYIDELEATVKSKKKGWFRK